MAPKEEKCFWKAMFDWMHGGKIKSVTAEACMMLREKTQTEAGVVELIEQYRDLAPNPDTHILIKEIPEKMLFAASVVNAVFSGLEEFVPGKSTAHGILDLYKHRHVFLHENADEIVVPIMDASIGTDITDYVLMLSILPSSLAEHNGVSMRLSHARDRHSDCLNESIGVAGLLDEFYNGEDKQTITTSQDRPDVLANIHLQEASSAWFDPFSGMWGV